MTGSTREAGPCGGHTSPFWGQASSRGDPLGSRIQEQGKGRRIHPSTPSSQQPHADGWARGSDHLGAPRGADAALSFPSQPYLSSFCFTSPSLPRLCQHLPAHPRAAAASEVFSLNPSPPMALSELASPWLPAEVGETCRFRHPYLFSWPSHQDIRTRLAFPCTQGNACPHLPA